MRRTVALFGFLIVIAAPAHAAYSIANCKTGPPKEWNQPRVSHTFSGQTWGDGYGSRSRSNSYSSSYSARSTTSRFSSSRAYR